MRRVDPFEKPAWWRAYSFPIVTGLLFLGSWYGQFIFQAREFADEAAAHGQTAHFSDYLPQFLASTFENWQSEFLQALWTVFGLAVFYHWGSAQSREQGDRLEAKVDMVLRRHGIDPDTLR